MTLFYDAIVLGPDDQPLKIATDWGKSGWRWINPPSLRMEPDPQHGVKTMYFEKEIA